MKTNRLIVLAVLFVVAIYTISTTIGVERATRIESLIDQRNALLD